MAILLANNARSALVSPIGALDTTITITSGTETLFPSPTGGDYFYATIEDSTKTIREIVKCTARTANVLTVTRAQDGTSATIFAAGSTVELRINKASLTDSIGAAANSATAAAASATAASNSAANASTSATNAATQVTLAAAQVALATTQANNAASSATAAASSATAANASAVAAAASAASGLYRQVLDKSANYTVVLADQGTLFRMNTGSGALTVTLPQISTVTDGFKVSVVKWTSDANAVNINRSGSDTINGATTVQIGSQYSQIIFVADFETNTWFASQSGLGATAINIDVKSGDGSTTAFTLTSDPSTKNNTNVFISGVYQAKATYSLTGTTLTFSTAPPLGTNNIEIEYATPLAIGTPSDGTVTPVKLSTGGPSWDTSGKLTATGGGVFGNGTVLGGATNPIVAMTQGATSYVQSYIVNTTNGTSSSADIVAYPSNGTDSHGWVDMGITSLTYADTTYTVTGPNESYVFGSAPSGSGTTGNLVYATDNTGTTNAHQFYVGGFTQAKNAWKMQITSSGVSIAGSMFEAATITAAAPSATTNYDVATQAVQHYTTNTANNWTLNLRGNSGTTLNSLLAVGQAVTIAFLATNGATAYYMTAIQVDGVGQTIKWQGGSAPTSGNANAIDVYSITLIKTASATYTVLASQTQFK